MEISTLEYKILKCSLLCSSICLTTSYGRSHCHYFINKIVCLYNTYHLRLSEQLFTMQIMFTLTYIHALCSKMELLKFYFVPDWILKKMKCRIKKNITYFYMFKYKH